MFNMIDNLELDITGQLIKDVLYNELYLVYFNTDVFYDCAVKKVLII